MHRAALGLRKLFKNHRPSNFGVALFRVPIDISGGLIIGVYDFEAAVYGLNGAWSKEAAHLVKSL